MDRLTVEHNQTVARVEDLAAVSTFKATEIIPAEVMEIARSERQHAKRLENNADIREKYAQTREKMLKEMTVFQRTAFEEVLD